MFQIHVCAQYVSHVFQVEESDNCEDNLSTSNPATSGCDTSIELVFPEKGKGGFKLGDQRPIIVDVCERAILGIHCEVLLHNAFPDGPERSSEYSRSALITSSKELGHMKMYDWLKHDQDYWCKLSSMVQGVLLLTTLYYH